MRGGGERASQKQRWWTKANHDGQFVRVVSHSWMGGCKHGWGKAKMHTSFLFLLIYIQYGICKHVDIMHKTMYGY